MEGEEGAWCWRTARDQRGFPNIKATSQNAQHAFLLVGNRLVFSETQLK